MTSHAGCFLLIVYFDLELFTGVVVNALGILLTRYLHRDCFQQSRLFTVVVLTRTTKSRECPYVFSSRSGYRPFI